MSPVCSMLTHLLTIFRSKQVVYNIKKILFKKIIYQRCAKLELNDIVSVRYQVKGCRMGRSDKVSLWYVSLLINTRFRFFILEQAIVKRI